jgi:hypothetical protein
MIHRFAPLRQGGQVSVHGNGVPTPSSGPYFPLFNTYFPLFNHVGSTSTPLPPTPFQEP